MSNTNKNLYSRIKELNTTDKLFLSISVILFAICLAICRANGVYTDLYWIIDFGDYVKEYHTLPSTNVWVIHENLRTTWQSWLSNLVAYGWYEITQENINVTFYLGWLYIVLNTLAAYKYLSIHTKNKSLALMTGTLCTLLSGEMLCPRSSLVTSALFFLELTLLTKYYITKETKSTQLIIGLSLISVFLANWQAAAWLFIIIFELPFIAEKLIYKLGILKTSTPKKELRNQLRCSIISTIAIILAGLVNPYTYESEIYLWLCREHTKFTGAIADYIEECTQVQFLSRMWFIVIACFAILMIGIALKKVKPYEFFLALGTILVAYKQQRQCYMLLYGISSILVSLILLKYDTISEKLSHKKTKLAVYYIQVFLTAFFICAAFTLNISNVVEDSFKSIADYMDSDVEANDLNKEDLKILTECWPSAYMQYRGYKTFEDCRPETLSKYISGQTPNTNNDLNMDVMEEYVILGYLVTDTEYFDNFFETYDFDYAILYNTNFIHYIEYHTDDWVEIDEEELISDTGINTKYRLFKRIRN